MPVSMRNLKAYVRAWMKLVRLACVQPGGCTQATKFCNLIDCLTIIRISAKLKDKTTSRTVDDRLHTRLGTLGSLSHNFKSSSECTKAALALLIGLLNDWAPFSRNAIFKLARETVSQKNKPTERKNRKTCALDLSPLFLVFPPFDFQNGGGLMRI